MIGNTNAKFIEQRREDLQKYLQTVAHILQKHMPSEFVQFLDFHKYDVIFLLQSLALDVFKNGEKYLFQNDRKWTFTILEVRWILLCWGEKSSQVQKFDVLSSNS